MARVPFDSFRLYESGDRDYRLWLEVLVSRVYATMEKQHRAGKG